MIKCIYPVGQSNIWKENWETKEEIVCFLLVKPYLSSVPSPKGGELLYVVEYFSNPNEPDKILFSLISSI